MPRRLISGANQVPCSARQHGVVGAALRDVDAERGHLHAAAAVRRPALLRRADPLPRDDLVRRVLAAGEEIAVSSFERSGSGSFISCACDSRCRAGSGCRRAAPE